jgi:hypothetical protein
MLRLVRRPGARRVDAGFAGGTAIGCVVLLAWLLWAFGGTLHPLVAQFSVRTGQTVSIPLTQLLAVLRHDTTAMFGVPALLALFGLVGAVSDRGTRGLAAISLVVTLSYPVLFRSGTVNHDYWNFWWVLPIALGLASAFDRRLRARDATCRLGPWIAASAAVVATLLTLVLWAHPSAPAWAMLEGRRAGSVAASEVLAPGQEYSWYSGAIGKPADWISLATGKPAVAIPRAGLTALAAAHPEDQVIVGRLLCPDGEPRVQYEHESAADLAGRPPEVVRCGTGSVGFP